MDKSTDTLGIHDCMPAEQYLSEILYSTTTSVGNAAKALELKHALSFYAAEYSPQLQLRFLLKHSALVTVII